MHHVLCNLLIQKVSHLLNLRGTGFCGSFRIHYSTQTVLSSILSSHQPVRCISCCVQVYYHSSQNPVFHQVAYALMTIATVFRNMYVMEAELRPAMKKRDPARVDFLMKQMWQLSFSGKYTQCLSSCEAVTDCSQESDCSW